MAKVEHPIESLNDDQRGQLRAYHIGLDADGQPVSKFKYMPGIVRQYRFDAKEGKFKLNMGGDNLKDVGKTLKMRPIAWRLFYDPNLFNMGAKDWAELFFIDDKNAVSAVLFHGYSVQALNDLIGPLYFDDLNLADVTLEITADKKYRKEDNGIYYIAAFTYEGAEPLPADLTEFLEDHGIYRAETLTEVSHVNLSHGMAFTVRPHGGFLAAPVEEATHTEDQK